ncbi:helix-turn-helix domain-containing protein [Sedimentitalea sp. JM2-8]|uniref:Helix-turn-helix domain-containing protein n=2 Tax=Sedimentitalea xiamensis TaxID=3050037 RepID=A0ABT7FHT3_9RHOB|nr:helix-turn-helix domain-containing protein [Sedimentitalea xiamensis]
METNLQEQMHHGLMVANDAVRRAQNPNLLKLAAHHVRGALIQALSSVREVDENPRETSQSKRILVEAAIEYLAERPDEPVAVSKITEVLRVNERMLQRAFQERMGMTLRSFERDRRLRAVHGTILAEGSRRSITDIAMSFGFTHLGRFSAAYSRMHGCAPSETRRRFWQDQTFGAGQAEPLDAQAAC